MGTPFTITIDACQPDKGTYADITISGPGGNQRRPNWDTSDCKLECPYSEEELKATCPNPEDRVKIYAWDPLNEFEAQNEPEKIAHEEAMELNGGAYGWFYDCEKCLECPMSLGVKNYYESHYCKCAEDDPNLLPIACPGAKIGPVSIYSDEFDEKCLQFYDVWASVSLSADNWGTIYAAPIITCPNEGTTSCNNKCNQQGEVLCSYETVGKQGDINLVKAKIMADATNSSNGGAYSLDVTASFYLKLKPKNK